MKDSRKWPMWLARIWSLPAIWFVAAELLFPHGGDAPVAWQDWVLLGCIAVAVLGLVAAWPWARIGGLVALGGYLLHVLLWPFLRGGLAPTWWMLGLFVALPAALFIWASGRD